MTSQSPKDEGDFPPIADDRIELEPDDFDPGQPTDVDPDADLDEQFRDLTLIDHASAEFHDQDAEDSDEEPGRRQTI